MTYLHRIALALAFAGTLCSSAGAQETPKPSVPVPAVPAVPEEPAPVTTEVPEPSVKDRLTFLLSGYEYFPTRADLDAVGSADVVAAQLRGMALDETERPSLRLRATDALGYYTDAESVTLLATLVSSEPKADLGRRQLRTAGLLRHHAITALAKSQREASVETLETIFAAKDLQLTLTAVHALGKHGGKRGAVALKKLRDGSDEHVVRREVAKWVK